MASLDPVFTVEDQIAETLLLHNRTRLLKIIEEAAENLQDLENSVAAEWWGLSLLAN